MLVVQLGIWRPRKSSLFSLPLSSSIKYFWFFPFKDLSFSHVSLCTTLTKLFWVILTFCLDLCSSESAALSACCLAYGWWILYTAARVHFKTLLSQLMPHLTQSLSLLSWVTHLNTTHCCCHQGFGICKAPHCSWFTLSQSPNLSQL
jgi:hypothetical protein